MGYDSIKKRKMSIRKLSTKELKTYDKAFKDGQVYKFARDEARAELKRRIKTPTIKKSGCAKRKKGKSGGLLGGWTNI